MNTHRAAIIGLTIATSIALAGCAQSHPGLSESDYIQLAQSDISFVANMPASQVRKIGKATCDELRASGPAAGFHMTAAVLAQGGFTNYEAGQFTAIAVSAWCPDLQSYLPGN